jgi:hypothetical protein
MKRERAEIVRLFNHFLKKKLPAGHYLDIYPLLLDESGMFLMEKYHCDGTHLNPSYYVLIKDEIERIIK